MKLLIHPGFHKTGTSSLQRGAMARMDVLGARMRLVIRDDLTDCVAAARLFSLNASTKQRRRFADGFGQALAALDPEDPRPVLITAEDLSGWPPGRHGVPAYDAAPVLMAAALDRIGALFGSAADVTVWYTTRAPAAWQRSMYWQNLRASRLTDDFDSYDARWQRGAQLRDIVEQVRHALGRQARVVSTPLEDSRAHPLGHLKAALDLLGLPDDGLDAIPVENVRPRAADAELLALNRSDLSDTELAEAKRALMRKLRLSGQMRVAPDRK